LRKYKGIINLIEMDLSNLKPAEGTVKKDRRLGRGQGTGRGGTATRGHKGQKSRSGYSKKIGFEGGQMPLQRRVPKYGFTNMNRVEYKGINISTLQALAEKKNLDVITLDIMIESGLISKKAKVKILAKGSLDKKLEVHAHAFSKAAAEAIEAQKGKVVKIN
jgi:large subunit ribosomal protein L15